MSLFICLPLSCTHVKYSGELINNLAIYSTGSTETSNSDTKSREWRNEVAYRALLLLRTSMAVIDYPTDKVPAWDVPELSGKELEDIKRNTYLNTDVRKLMHAKRSEYEESMRVPIRMSYLLKKSIHSQSRKDSKLKEPMSAAQEMKLIGSDDAYMQGYYGMRKFLTTPVPFPLVQMARTFLFLYVFTIPFALLSDKSLAFAHLIQVFILTYGFAGYVKILCVCVTCNVLFFSHYLCFSIKTNHSHSLELVAIELDNPFGDDENDFEYVPCNDAFSVSMHEMNYVILTIVSFLSRIHSCYILSILRAATMHWHSLVWKTPTLHCLMLMVSNGLRNFVRE